MHWMRTGGCRLREWIGRRVTPFVVRYVGSIVPDGSKGEPQGHRERGGRIVDGGGIQLRIHSPLQMPTIFV